MIAKNIIVILIILFGSISLGSPLTKSGLYTMHDDQQVARLFLFDKSLKLGQFPVRWVDELGFGYGYPLFVFYPPLVYMIGEAIHWTGFGFIDSVKIVFFLSIFLSGISMYIFVKDLWGKFPATISALFYMFVPYRAVDVYVRGALAESFSFVWLPLILWSFYKLSNLQGQSDYKLNKPSHTVFVCLSAIFLALLMITHNLIFLPFMLLLPIYLLFLILEAKEKKKTIFYFLFSVLYSFGLSAFFWIPALIEKKFTIVDNLLLTNLADYKIHFVYPKQLWNWPWGFGGSAAGLSDGISFKIGKLHILTSVAALVLTLINLAKNRTVVKTFSQLLARRSFSEVGSTVFFILFLFSAFITTSYSNFIWELIPPLGYLQFPWRFLTFTALFSSILAGAFIYLLRISSFRLIVGTTIIGLLFITNFKLFKPQTYRQNLTDEIATSPRVINWDVSSTSFEYLPKGVNLDKSDLGTNVVNIKTNDIPSNKLEVIQGEGQIKNLISEPDKLSFSLEAKNDLTIQANIFNFPGWQVLINNNPIQINDNNRLKLITFEIPQGLSEVELIFRNTPVRTFANMITLTSLISLTLLVINAKTRNEKFEMRK